MTDVISTPYITPYLPKIEKDQGGKVIGGNK